MKYLKIETLNKGYCDPDTILIHACFQCLVNFVEKEGGLTHCNYEAHKDQIDKCKELYEWWKINHEHYDPKKSEYDEKLMELVKIYHFLWT